MLLLFGIAGLLQLLTPVPFDADTAYHVAVARLMRTHGLLHAFPWTPFSWLADNYADKELLFHLLLLPVAGLSWITAAKIVGTLAGGLALGTLYLVLRAERVPRAGLWTLLALVCSGAFAFRFALVRPHLLSIPLAILVTWAAARRRHGWLALGCFLYPLTYIGWPMALGLALGAELLAGASGRRPAWTTPAVAALAAGAGVLLHPNIPDILRFTWLVNIRILVDTAWTGRAGFDLGAEFQPFSPEQLLRHVLPPALLAASAAVIGWRERARDPLPLVFACAAGAYLLLTLRTSRFLEYLAPFAAVAAALAASRAGLGRRWAAPVLGVAFAFTVLFGSDHVLALGRRGDDVPPRFAEYLRASIPEGAQVFTCEWGLTGELMLAMPERRFIVALDPVLFWRKDPERYALWYRLPREGGPEAAEQIRRGFDARYVLCANDPRWSPLFRSLDGDASARVLFANPLWRLYQLAPATDP
jgi:hypothetical protein